MPPFFFIIVVEKNKARNYFAFKKNSYYNFSMKSNKTYIFWGLAALVVFLFVLVIKNILPSNLPKYPVFPTVYNAVNVILDTKTNNNDDIILKVNDEYYSVPNSKELLNKTIKYKTDKISILVDKNFKNEIKNIVIFNDLKSFYFNDFSKFDKKESELCLNNNCRVYYEYDISDHVKYNKNASSINFHSNTNLICNIVLSLFSGSLIFAVPYILLFILIIYFINNKKEIKIFKFNPYILTVSIFLFGSLMYSNGMLDYLPWPDEYRTIEYSDPKLPFMTIFTDPGNPPLFYLLFRIFIGFFGVSILTMKLFPFIIGILAIFIMWLILKCEFDIKTANIGAFLAFINVPLVYYSEETRSYILQALFSPVLIWTLFRILNTNKKKYYFIYAILAAVISNIHYYEILLLVSIFIYAFIYLIIQKRYFDIFKFFLANLFGAICFLPFFTLTAFNKALNNSTFNNWIPPICFNQIKKCTYYIFGGLASFLISAFVFIKTILKNEIQNERRNDYIICLFSVILMTIIQGVILSYSIRPMLVERYLLLLSPLFIMFLAIVFTKKYNNKFAVIFFLIWVILIQAGSFEKNNRRKGILENPLRFSKQYYENKEKNENIYAILNISNPEYLENKDDYMNENITYISRSIFIAQETIDKILNKDKNAVIFTSTLSADEKNSKTPDNYKCYFNSSTDLCLWKITGVKNK